MPRVRGMHGQRLDHAVERVEGVVARVLRGIARTIASLVGASPSTAALSDDDLQPIRQVWEKAVGEDIVPALAETYVESARTLAGEFSDVGRAVEPLTLDAPKAADFLDAATNRLVGVSDTLWEIARKELADGVRAGDGVEELAARLQEAGGFGIARARMIARTEVVAASNAASLAQALRLGDPSMTKTWDDSDDTRVRPAHEDADGQTVPVGEPFEVGGEFLMYPGQPIGSAANVINCFPGAIQVRSCGDVRRVYRRWYEGVLVRVNTAGGVDLSGTPNHPVLTDAGWKALQHLNVGNKLVKASVSQRMGGSDPEVDDAPPEFAEVYRAATEARVPDRIVGSGVDFHGDGTDSEVEVVSLDGGLPSPSGESTRDLVLMRIGDAQATLAGSRHFAGSRRVDVFAETGQPESLATSLVGRRSPGASLVRSRVVEADASSGPAPSNVDAPVGEPQPYGVSAHAERFGDGLLGDAGNIETGNLVSVHVPPLGAFDGRTGVDPRLAQSLPDGHGCRADRFADVFEREPLTFEFDEVSDVELLPFSGHVYNLETDGGAYVANSIVVSNCRCTLTYDVGDIAQDNVDIEVLTAAAEVHTGAMVALRPSAEDAKRLAVDGGEPADQLHATLAYLGAAADIPDEAQARIIEAIYDAAEQMPGPLTVDGFAVSAFNPGETNDRDPCVVLGLSGDGLDDVHGHVMETLANLQAEPAGFTLPDQHSPWQPHVTLIYTDDVSMVEQLADKVGPVTFDAIRVAFGGEVFDILLGEPAPEDEGAEEDDDFDWDAYLAQAIQAQFQSRMPPQLQAHWIRKLRLGTPGSFRKCVRELRPHFPEDPEGLCANLYRTATGHWPGRKKANAALTDADNALAVELPDDGLVSAETAGEPAAPDPLAALPGEHFHTWVMEGVSTGLRQFAPGAITWRDPPFAYHWQWKSSAHNGLPETVQTGLVTRVARDGNVVHFFGKLDLKSPEGLDYARRVAEGWARWSSVGVDESVKNANIDVEYVLSDGEPPADEEPEVDLMTFRDYRVAEVTGVSVPALADALVEPTPELIETLTRMGVIEGAPDAEPELAPETTSFDTAGEPMPELNTLAAVEDAAPGDVTVDLNDDGTITLGWGASDMAAEVTVPAADAAALADGVERLLGADPGASEQVGAVTLTRTEGGDVELSVEGAIPALLTAVDAEGLVEVLREFVLGDVIAEVEEIDDEVMAASAQPVRTVVRTVAFVTRRRDTEVVVASGHTITIPDVPPAEWFAEPTDVDVSGALTVTDEGRIYGMLAPANIAHRAFRNRRVEVPRGNVDYSRWMGGEAIVAGGGRVVAGPITMNCGHMPPHASADPGTRMEHYENTCSVVAQAAIGENDQGVWIAGALLPGVSAEQVSRMLACRLSGDWAPHPEKSGWREFVAALLVPVPGFPMARSAPSTVRVADGALVAAAVPVRLEVSEPEEPDVVVASVPDLRPVMEVMARSVGRDAASRMAALRNRVHQPN